MLLQGDSREVLRTLEDGSVDSIVTDPPYELGFMGKAWDATGVAYDVALWRECLRVLRPGGHLLAFGGTRTYHRMAVAIEEAGFEVRDQLQWLYGSGFPKSHNGPWGGTALKPANEPICMARKPLIGTVAENVQAHGTGALNIDGCRIATTDSLGGGAEKGTTAEQKGNDGWTRPWMENADAREAHAARVRSNVAKAEELGRWPANVLLDEEAARLLDEQTGTLTSGANPTRRGSDKFRSTYGEFVGQRECTPARGQDSGGASRFFYVAKPSRDERNAGGEVDNTHATVKPVELLEYLVRLVTPPGGTVLDPFMGSGTTGIAALNGGWTFIGIELLAEHYEVARQRIAALAGQSNLFAAWEVG